MFRPYEEDWVQPFTCFATKGAAKDEMLYELLAKAVCVLYNHLAIVKNFVSDGHQANKKVATIFGIQTVDPCKTYFLHPMTTRSRFIALQAGKVQWVKTGPSFDRVAHISYKFSTNECSKGRARSEGTERLTKLMNDVFDVLNGRCSSQGITKDNWEAKKKVLNAMLTVLNRTEDVHMRHDPDLPAQMFCSETTCWN
ncbi:hypothetical protein OUZ56_021696 [Daphnia magna]|uniref:Transposable element P transposase-like RNase H domain-containing protein n=1 Tax=Daphnia magna TaxID=35525 RepID=A0ABR0AU79_9CRUS|nr:hypothetical protein OUZ56_021696 [Daphnia magna]